MVDLGYKVNLSGLRALTGMSTDDVVTVYGRDASGDWGPARHARWISSDMSTYVPQDEVTSGEGDGGILVAPASDKTGASGCWIFDHDGYFNVRWYGAFGKFGDLTNDGPAINQCISMASNTLMRYISPYGRPCRIRIPAGHYYTDEPIILESESLYLEGDGTGSMWDTLSSVQEGTVIIGTAQTGPIIWVRRENCYVGRIRIESQETVEEPGVSRKDSTPDNTQTGLNCGLRVEGENVCRSSGEGDVMHTVLEDILIKNQPNSGVMLVGKCYESRLIRIVSKNNNGHGFQLDDGTNTGRTVDDDDDVGTNYQVGIVSFQECESRQNQGHGWCIGDESNNNYTHRIMMVQCESSQNCNDTSLLIDPSDPSGILRTAMG